MNLFKCVLLGFVLVGLTACGHSKKTLKVAATPVPHAEILEEIKPLLKQKGIDLEVVVVDDYHLPNRALEEHEVDANFFQHRPFLDLENEQFGYHLVEYQKVHIEPMGLYGKSGMTPKIIAIPSDPSNQARALVLLESQGLVHLKKGISAMACCVLDVESSVKLVEIDAALLARTLDDVDLAVIPTNFALQAGIMDKQLIREKSDSPFVNILVVRAGEENRPELVALKEALVSRQAKDFLFSHYKGVIVPTE